MSPSLRVSGVTYTDGRDRWSRAVPLKNKVVFSNSTFFMSACTPLKSDKIVNILIKFESFKPQIPGVVLFVLSPCK